MKKLLLATLVFAQVQILLAQPSTPPSQSHVPKIFQQRTEGSLITLDSIIEGENKTAYFYNNLGQNTSEITYVKDGKGLWSPLTLVVNEYDQLSGKLLLQNFYPRTEDGKGWGILSRRYVYLLDEKSNIGSYFHIIYDQNRGVIDTVARASYTYDNYNLEIGGITYNQTDLGWGPFPYKRERTYDSQGNNVEIISHTMWDSQTQNWTFKQREQYKYDAYRRVRADSVSEWDFQKGTWKWDSKREYGYDSRNDMTSTVISSSVDGTDSWKYVSKTESQYDLNHNRTAVKAYYWLQDSSIWKLNERFRVSYIYDSIPQSLVAYPLYFNYNSYSKNRLLYYESSIELYSKHFYYSDFTTDLRKEEPATEARLFPNPATHIVEVENISLEGNCTWYDVLGKSYPCKKSAPTSLDLELLPSGAYTLQISSPSISKTFRVLKK